MEEKRKRGRPKGSKNKPKEESVQKKSKKPNVIKMTVDGTKYGLGIKEYKVFEEPVNVSELQSGDRVIIADGREGEFICIMTEDACSIRMDDSKFYNIKNQAIRRKKAREAKNEPI